MRMGIGLGVGINRSNYAQGIFGAYATRVVADGGVVEGGACVDAVSSLLQSASLLLVPSGFKGGRLYSQIPTNGNGDLTWTRGSDGFRTNASGLIQRVPWNLASYSEAFDNAAWTKSNVTITANSTTAPDGNNTADAMFEQAINGLHFSRQAITVINGNTYTLSAYVKANGRDWCIMVAGSGGNGYYFNIASGSVGSQTGGTGTVSNPQIQSVGNGWFRISYQLVAGSTAQGLDLWTSTGNNNFSFLGDVTKGLFIWGAQLVEGTTAQTYLPTTDRLNFPRLSYMYGSCPAVLLEPQRTNLVTYSEQFDNSAWTKINTTITANSTTSPDGTTNADFLIANTTLDQHRIDQAPTSSAGTQTFSIYAKAGGYGFVGLRIGLGGALFNLSTGATSLVGAGYAASAELAANGFYRCILTKTSAISNDVPRVNISDGTAIAPNFSGNNTDGIFIYGAQLEAGAYPTTYISTTSATATRVADSFSRNNIYTNGLITSSGGTLFFEFRGSTVRTRDSFSLIGIGDTTTLDGNSLVLFPSSRFSIAKYVGGSATPLGSTSTDTLKVLFKWNGSTADIFVNGTKIVSATTFTTTNMQFLTTPGVGVPMFIQQMALYPSPLSDTDCTTITTL